MGGTAPTLMWQSAREGNVLLNLRRIPTLWAHLSYTYSRRVARMLRVWRTHHPYADFFFFFFWLTRFLIAHATNTKTQMKKNERSGLLFTSSLLAKSGLEVTPLCREATRCKHRYRARAPSRSTSTESGIGSTFRAPRPSHWVWCASPALHHDHVLCVHRKNGAATMNIPVEQELEEGTKRWKKILLAVFDETFRRESWLIRWKVCACRSLLRRRLRSWSDRYGRSKVVEVFRRLRDGDPVEIEKNFRCSSDNLVVSSMSIATGIISGRQGDVCARVITLRDSHQRLQQCAEMASGLFHADSLLAQERKKTAWVALAVSGEDNLSIWLFFSVVAACLLKGWWLKNITEILLFMHQIFRIFKIFRGAAPNPAWGLTAPPKTPSWSKGRFAPCCALRSMHLIFQKFFTNHPWPLTSYAPDTPCQCGCSRSECRWRLLQDLCEFSLVVSECQP